MGAHSHSQMRFSGVARLQIDGDHFDVPVKIDVPCFQPGDPTKDPDEALRKEALWIAGAVITEANFDESYRIIATGTVTVVFQRECGTCGKRVGRLIAFTMDLSQVQSKTNPMTWLELEHEVLKALVSMVFMSLKSRGPFPAARICN